MKSVKWGEYRIGDLFEIKPTRSYKLINDDLFDENGINPVVTNSSLNNGITGYTNLSTTEKGNMITYSDTTTSEGIFYQPNDFVGYSHIQGLYTKNKQMWSKNSLIYFVSVFRKSASGKFDYGNKFNRKIASEMKVILPITKNGKIDFKFMESFIAELEARRIAELEARRIAELEAYLDITGLSDYTLTKQEQKALDELQSVEWGEYNLKNLFGESTRGKRLKSFDRIKGNLPFVTAGEALEGVSAYIGNDVEIFKPNTITIDMFGSAKYRNYDYGADDHVAVVHTEKLSKHASIFITSAVHKKSHNGDFSYSKNFYVKDADNLNIKLPIKNGEIDYGYMETLIKAVEKMVIKDVVLYKDKKIEATRKVVNK